MAMWVVRAGQHGEGEQAALDRGMAVIGLEDLPDLSPIETRENLAQLMQITYPDEGPKKLAHWTGQVWAFRNRIQ
jgi:restriction system protein